MTLVIMAAGMGARFGGLKQIEPVDSSGHILIDYSVHYAIRAGFDRVVFIIRRDIEQDFKKITSSRIAKWGIDVDYAFQEITDLPFPFRCPKGRKKPWGTAHAVASLDGLVDAPFALINADDYYGPTAFLRMSEFLLNRSDRLAMVAYRLKNTLSKNGSVSRGLCSVSGNRLVNMREVSGIRREGDSIISDTDLILDPDQWVSMNFWGFTPDVIKKCKSGFYAFLKSNLSENPLRCEYYITDVIADLVTSDGVEIEVMESYDRWYGVTHRADKAEILAELDTFIKEGRYPDVF